MTYNEKNHQIWLKNLIEKKVSSLGKDEYASYFNIFINNQIFQIAYDGEMICSAIYLHKNVIENGGIIDSTTVLKLEEVRDEKIIKQLNDFITKYISENQGDKYAKHEEFIGDINYGNETNNAVTNSEFITGTMFKLRKEDISLDYLIENKIVKNVLTDVEEYGLNHFVFCQFSEQVEDENEDNFITCSCDIHGVFGLFIYSDETPIFINDELLDSVYLGNDNKIYYLTEEENIYSYIQQNHTVRNECNRYPV